MRSVFIELMKSQTPSVTLTHNSIAPTPFISGIARFGSRSAARSTLAISSSRSRKPSRFVSVFANGSGRSPFAASACDSRPSLSLLKSTPQEFIRRYDKNQDGYLSKDDEQ